MALPDPQLKQLFPYVQRAEELEKHDLTMCYYCRLYAVQLGLDIKPMNPETKKFLVGQMGKLEAEKQELANQNLLIDDAEAQMYIEGFALKVFQKADTEDRAGNATKGTVRAFYVSSLFMNVLKQFGPLPPEIKQKALYAQLKATDIAKAFREGRVPKPGPLVDEGPEDEVSENEGDEPTGRDEETDTVGRPTDEFMVPRETVEQDHESEEDEVVHFQIQSSTHPGVPSTGMERFPDASAGVPGPQKEGLPASRETQPVQPRQQIMAVDTSNSVPIVPMAGYCADDDECELSLKYARFAVNALQFSDVSSAVTNLVKSLKILTLPPSMR